MKKAISFVLVFILSFHLVCGTSNHAFALTTGYQVIRRPTINNYNVPSTLKAGRNFTIKGTVSCDDTICSVVVGAFPSKKSEHLKAGKAFQVNRKSCNLSKSSSESPFSTLKKGTYYYKVIVLTSTRKETILCKQFKVK